MAENKEYMFQRKGCRFFIESPTNQQFVILRNEQVKRLEKEVIFTHWGKYDHEHTICRFVTSWATTDEDPMCLKRYWKGPCDLSFVCVYNNRNRVMFLDAFHRDTDIES